MIKINSQKTQFERLKKRSGKNVEVVKSDFTKLTTVAIIKEFDNSPNNSTDDKTIFFSIGDNIQQGDLIKYENNTYIILLQQENINNVYCIYVMRRCDTTIKMYINKKLYEIPCNISTFSQDVFENKYLNLPSGNIKVTIQNNDISKEITYNKRFIKMGNVWKVVGFTSENKGLKYIYCEKTEINNTYDDIENEIADRWKHEVKHNYSMTIDTDNITLEQGQTKQLIVNINDTIDDKTETVENPILIYTSLNENIVKIDDKGLIKGISEGETTIKVQFENIDKIINVKVTDNVAKPEIVGEDYIILGWSEKYTSTIPVNWNIEDVDNNTSTKWGKIDNQNENGCTVKVTDKWIFNDDYGKYIKLIATSKDDNKIKVEKKIQIKTL